jgi:adenylate kinase family enzyme
VHLALAVLVSEIRVCSGVDRLDNKQPHLLPVQNRQITYKLCKLVQEFTNREENIPDNILIDLIEERINRKDCQMQGFILDGFPNNLVQLQALNNLKIFPDTIYVLELEDSENLVYERLQKTKNRNQINKMFL